MPPVPPIAQVVRVRLRHTLGSDFDVLDRFYIQYIGAPPSTANCNAFATDITESWVLQLEEMCADTVSLTEVVVTDLSSDTANEGSDSTTATGTRSGGPLPASNACLINFRVARRYRGGKPRMYMPFGTDSDVLTPQGWSGGFITQATTQWNAFMSAVISSAWSGAGPLTQVSVSYYQGSIDVVTGTPPYQRGKTKPLPRPGGPIADTITSFAINPVFGSQRRRNRPK